MTAAAPGTQPSPVERVIIDTDFNLIDDDGQVAILAAHAVAARQIDLLGLTLVAGNNWLDQEEVYALKAVERLGLPDLPVFAGAREPLLHDRATFDHERALFGGGDGYWGAWTTPEPADRSALTAPPDGFASAARIQDRGAVDFLVDAIRKHPGQVTVIAIGPLTNIALAMKLAPDIIPALKKLVIMGGAFDVRGNTTPAAEFNIWFDPEAARIVFRSAVPKLIFPLDVTDTAPIDASAFADLQRHADPIVARLLPSSWSAKALAADPNAKVYFYDTLAFAAFLDPSLIEASRRRIVDVDTSFGPTYGKTLSYDAPLAPRGLSGSADIVLRMDQKRFWDYYRDGMSARLPVDAARP